MRVEQPVADHVELVLLGAPAQVRAGIVRHARHALVVVGAFGMQLFARVEDRGIDVDADHVREALPQCRGDVVAGPSAHDERGTWRALSKSER